LKVDRVQGAWRREGRRAGDVRVIGERVSRLGGKHLEERTGGALDWCIVAPVPRAADHTLLLPACPCPRCQPRGSSDM
jgi:hypothetical protein